VFPCSSRYRELIEQNLHATEIASCSAERSVRAEARVTREVDRTIKVTRRHQQRVMSLANTFVIAGLHVTTIYCSLFFSSNGQDGKAELMKVIKRLASHSLVHSYGRTESADAHYSWRRSHISSVRYDVSYQVEINGNFVLLNEMSPQK